MDKKGRGFYAAVVLLVCIISGMMFGLFLVFSQKPDELKQQTAKKEESGDVLDYTDDEEPPGKEIAFDAFSIGMEMRQESLESDKKKEEESEDAKSEEYLCSYISDRRLTDDDVAELKGKSYGDLPPDSTVIQMVINELYAKHGYEFQNKEIEKYFEQKKWYQKITQRTSDMDAISEQMSGIEKANVDFLRANDD